MQVGISMKWKGKLENQFEMHLKPMSSYQKWQISKKSSNSTYHSCDRCYKWTAPEFDLSRLGKGQVWQIAYLTGDFNNPI